MQLLAQGFESIGNGGMEDAQGIVIAADEDAVEVLHVDMGLSVKMCACVATFVMRISITLVSGMAIGRLVMDCGQIGHKV